MFSSKWHEREKGVTEFTKSIYICFKNAKDIEKEEKQGKKDQDDNQLGLTMEQRCNQAILQSMAEVLKDKVQQVLNRAFPMVTAYLEYVNNNRNINPKQDISILESFLFSLLDKLVD